MRSDDKRFVICINNTGYPASLEIRKLYEVVPDLEAEKDELIRVIDESGDDYLYPAAMFLPIDLSTELRDAIRRAS